MFVYLQKKEWGGGGMASCQVIESYRVCLGSILFHLSAVESMPFCPQEIRSRLLARFFAWVREAPCMLG